MILNFELILTNLGIIGYGLALFSICWFSNFMVSLWYNIGMEHEKFSIGKMTQGILKLIALVIGIGALVLAFTLIPEYLTMIGFQIQDEWVELFNIIGIIGIIITSAVTYGKQSLTTISDIFNGGKK